MWKTIAFVMSIISSIIAITIYSTTLPDTKKQVEDNAAAIAKNAEDISDLDENITSVDNSVDGLNTRLETLEGKKLYLHQLYFTDFYQGSATYYVYCQFYSQKSTAYLYNEIFSLANEFRLTASGTIKIGSDTYIVNGIQRISQYSTSFSISYFPAGAPVYIDATKTFTDTVIEV